MKYSMSEEFFQNNTNIDRVFAYLERADYALLYMIEECMKEAEPHDKAYLAELAVHAGLSMPDMSKAVKKLEGKGYVTWKLDHEKKRTYIKLTETAVDLMEQQRKKLSDCYEQIVNTVPKEELDVTMKTLHTIREIVKE